MSLAGGWELTLRVGEAVDVSWKICDLPISPFVAIMLSEVHAIDGDNFRTQN